ncbi:MAG: N-6 DNA methylase [Planctomycetes bacterium]|nr:N-6 DNA methylase [Planctomycetota bacterium]
MAKIDPYVLAHLEWIGFVRPTGLVVSATALSRAGAVLERVDAEGQRLLRACVVERTFDPKQGPEPYLADFGAFARTVLGWSFSPKLYAGTPEVPIPPELVFALPDYQDALRPDFAVREPDPQDGASPWQLLVRVLEPGEKFDEIARGRGGLEASPHGRMERLLREKRVGAGLLVNGRALRLISAPRGESSGWIDFRVADMLQTAGRPISAAMRLLLSERRLVTLPRSQRLASLLHDSRKYQNEVSERLAEQVLHALYELLRGFQSAHDASRGQLLHDPLTEHPDQVYRALLTVILRLVFLLYAEERDMLPDDDAFERSYSLAGLYDRLREDAALFPDTMDQRFGAWAQLLVLFRMIHDGAESGALKLPRRHGVLFDPDRYPFLEGRRPTGARQIHERIEPPLVPDGTIYRALEKLLVLDGERISYRALDVEQIGSVYETMMGFRLETATGRSVAVRSSKKQGAPTAVDLELLLAETTEKRAKWLQDRTDRKLTDKLKKEVAAAKSLEDLHAALQPVVDAAATPDLVPKGAMVLQPSEERRRSGSHYTPRALTEPIVRTTLDPILARLRGADGRPPRPEQILDLKVCDPAMGSGAFLVEACRQLGDALVESWHAHGEVPKLPPDEDEVGFARRLVAQRCLYGVDRNPVAVDLAKVSLWLVTLAKDHPLTFLDHALRHGDSLVCLSREQIEVFHWDTGESFESIFRARMREQLQKVVELRQRIREADEGVTDSELRDIWDKAQFELSKTRLAGDLVVAAFFEGEKPREREVKRSEYLKLFNGGGADRLRGWLDDWRDAEKPLAPFHWEIEFPEVFDRKNPGFDAIVGNPPFQGGRNVTATQGDSYSSWLLALHEGSSGGADLVAHFFRRAFNLVRDDGPFGLIATNTIAQGDTRATGLRWICKHGGEIFAARKRFEWAGPVAVVVSIVHVIKGSWSGPKRLDDRLVNVITAFLFHRGGHEDPARLSANAGQSFVGSYVLGMGFTFDDADMEGVATSLASMRRIIEKDSNNQEIILPYIGGEEVNTSPTHVHHRYIINFGERNEDECRRRWPDLMSIVETNVKPERLTKDPMKYPRMVNDWWKHWNARSELYSAVAQLDRVLVTSRVRAGLFTFIPARTIFSEQLIVFPLVRASALAVLQSRIHDVWMRFFSGTALELVRYTPTDCFETFPFPENWETHAALEAAGKAYYEFRAELMVRNDEGLTKTYNRFHDPNERDPDIVKLRELHAAMDRAVLDAYGWSGIKTDCEFLLDYEIDEDEWGDKKKPYRYRWPEPVRDEVLARLLELNAERAKEESRTGAAASKKRARKPAAKRKPEPQPQKDLFS